MDLILLGLATFRLSLLFSKESGPYHIFRNLRKLPPPKSSAREGLSCQWCMSIWSSAVVLSIHRYSQVAGHWIILWLAVSALAIIVNQQWSKT